MKRRAIVRMTGAAALGAALPSFAQQASRVYRIGVLSDNIPRPYLNLSLLGTLRSLGYEEGRNLLVDFKFSQGRPDLLPALAAQLVAAKPDLIAASSNPETAALKRATSGIPIVMMFASTPVETDAALATLAADPPDGLGVATTGTILANVARVVELASRSKIPALYTTKVPVAGGGLMSYGPDLNEIIRRHTWMMDKILKGAKPGDIPVEEPAKFELSINLKTAKALGLTIQRALLLQADEVIE